MANCYSWCRTNFFAVTNEPMFNKLIGHIRSGESSLYHEIDANGKHFLGAEDSLDYAPYPSETQSVIDLIAQKRLILDDNGNTVVYSDVDSHSRLYDVSGECIYDEDYVDCDFDIFLNKLQTILPNDEHFEMFLSGHEKIREVYGDAIFMTNKVKEWTSLEEWMYSMRKQHCP